MGLALIFLILSKNAPRPTSRRLYTRRIYEGRKTWPVRFPGSKGARAPIFLRNAENRLLHNEASLPDVLHLVSLARKDADGAYREGFHAFDQDESLSHKYVDQALRCSGRIGALLEEGPVAPPG